MTPFPTNPHLSNTTTTSTSKPPQAAFNLVLAKLFIEKVFYYFK
jgi:hypothetical protein